MLLLRCNSADLHRHLNASFYEIFDHDPRRNGRVARRAWAGSWRFRSVAASSFSTPQAKKTASSSHEEIHHQASRPPQTKINVSQSFAKRPQPWKRKTGR
jgi:hypothetical protein